MTGDVERLRRRLEREREARSESERIAEHATRTLFDRAREVELLRTVAATANSSERPDGALAQVLAAVCEHTGWPVGHAWVLSGGRLRSSGLWSLADLERFEEFRSRTSEQDFVPGLGLPGHVMDTHEPAWVADIAADHGFLRREAAGAVGLRSALAFPLLAGEDVVGVLEFFSLEARGPDERLLGLMAQVGTQAGRVLERARAREELERSNHDLEQFAHRISHDLQEPLRTVTAFADLLERRHGRELEGDAGEFLHFVTDGARRMSEMVSGLLDFSRAGQMVIAGERADTGAVAEQALAALRARVAETGARVEIAAGLPEVEGSSAGLGQVFQNLIGNAIKFARPGTQPRVTVSVEADVGDWVFTITDEGIGIDPAHRERIFDVFERLHTREHYDGSGIGLAVTRRIVERHGGRIWAEANDPHGTALRFTIPRS